MCCLFTSADYVCCVCSHLQFIFQRLTERKHGTYVFKHQIQIRNTFNTSGIIDCIVFCEVVRFLRVYFIEELCRKVSDYVAYRREMINGRICGIQRSYLEAKIPVVIHRIMGR